MRGLFLGTLLAVALTAVGCAGSGDPTVAAPPSGRATPSAAASPSPSPSPTSRVVKIFLVAVGDEGKLGPRFGCGDSIVPADRTVAATTSPLRSAVELLIADRSNSDVASGHYNAFHDADLTVDTATVDKGKALIKLNGQLNLRGVCDGPRVTEQLNRTALQFPDVRTVEVLVDGRPLADVLSLK